MKDGMQYRRLNQEEVQKLKLHGVTMIKNRKQAMSMAGYLKLIGAPYRNVLNCANMIVVGIDKQSTVRIRHINRCKNPLCPNCQKVIFKKRSIHNAKILDKMVEQTSNGAFEHFTFSCENATDGNDLHQKLIKLGKAMTIFFGYEEVKRHLVGFINSLEDKTDWSRGEMEYNCHSHSVAYFDTNISFDVKKYWRRAAKRCGLTRNAYSHSEKIKATKGHTALDNSKKVLNYDDKPYNPLDTKLTKIKSKKNQIKFIRDHAKGLYRIQKVTYGGRCKTIHHNIKQVDEAKKILYKKNHDCPDIFQAITKFNNKRNCYCFYAIQYENHFIAQSNLTLKELAQYRDSQPYVE